VGFLTFLNNWWNLPFLVMLGLVGVFYVLQLIGLMGHDGDADADADHDADGDGDHDADGDHDGLWHGTLAFLGVGRVPFMVIWVTFFLFAGFSGLLVNRVIAARDGYPGWLFVVACAVALVVGTLGVRIFSRLAARFVDVGGRGSVQKHELAGKVGIVASASVDDKFGEIRVRDPHGNEMLVHGRLQPGEPPLPRGTKLVLIDYDPGKELFWVTAAPDLDNSN
jgi:hypothetical protein